MFLIALIATYLRTIAARPKTIQPVPLTHPTSRHRRRPMPTLSNIYDLSLPADVPSGPSPFICQKTDDDPIFLWATATVGPVDQPSFDHPVKFCYLLSRCERK
ncbi:hypothetical protein Q1695_010843 [Nippostrongylus brasiliensis]|nr:hypothetical protein Q1695_010843 [Nippostrongylus brasiliensis]